MDRVEQVFEQFAAAWRAGRIDPTPFLDELTGEDRDRLERRIEVMLLSEPPREWDPEAFEGSELEALSERLFEDLRCPAGEWPEVIPRLMVEGQLERGEVVERLAAGIGAEGEEQVSRVGEYFHRMTWGTIDASGVSDRVLSRLAEILDAPVEVLREAGRRFGRRNPTDEGGLVFARRVTRPREDPGMASPSGPAGSEPSRQPDRIDLLFTGGPEAGREEP